ncbi:dynein gamma chain, flagellar outer arm [Reticulomyxa filosa]|uniref:Dynein gamma chain, flagellar outer arm n=1 Tax=Reticulomyxa filosa TaxID=46433 RepID=X6M8P5_RETFI|nr:dynein gamma chain, flagellar outer arm [Reticulomyxa filosa]|eukprot:ETO09365.1 dynein gamma chain, flagellar outer arm [Reticulomyxa filosa]
MEKFKANPRVFHPKESHRIVKKYNSLVFRLCHFEMQFFEAWKLVCEQAKRLLQSSIIVKYTNTEDNVEEFYANFDRHLFEFMRESKFLLDSGKDIPQSARIILLLQNKLKANFNKVKNVCEMYNHLMRATSPIIRSIIEPHISVCRIYFLLLSLSLLLLLLLLLYIFFF